MSTVQKPPTETNVEQRSSTGFGRPKKWSTLRRLVLSLSTIAMTGCAASPVVWTKTVGNDTYDVDKVTSRLDVPTPEIYQTSYAAEPITTETLASGEFDNYSEITLDHVFRLALENSTVIRNLGAVVISNPNAVQTRFKGALAETDPRFGMEAALSAFDAQFTGSVMLNDNDRLFNNSFFAGGTSAFVQDLHEYNLGLTKRTASGAQVNLRSTTLYDTNNAPVNTFPSVWESILEAEVRQPLLQGAGLEFNRIAGPGALPGIYNGILIAKANTDITQHEFQIALRDFLSNVENAYWDLYYAYRVLDARKKALEQAQRVWNVKKAGVNQGQKDAPDESLARQQYYEFKANVEDAISGRGSQGTQTGTGSSGGTLQGIGGVLAAERRLRLLVGLPAGDGNLLRPVEEPPMAKVDFDWPTISQEALTQREELKRQQVVVRKHEMELLAAENFLNPRFDAVARYRVRGLGDDLLGSGPVHGDAPGNAVGNQFTGDHQEYMLGFELEVPLGYRRGHAAVSNAEFNLSHARAIHKEQQREVINHLAGAVAESARAYTAIEIGLDQYLAAKDYLDALKARKDLDDSVDRELDAQVRLVEAEVRLFRARCEYALALKNIQFEKGTLLSYANLQMVDDSLPDQPPTELQPADEVPDAPIPSMEAHRDSHGETVLEDLDPSHSHGTDLDSVDNVVRASAVEDTDRTEAATSAATRMPPKVQSDTPQQSQAVVLADDPELTWMQSAESEQAIISEIQSVSENAKAEISGFAELQTAPAKTFSLWKRQKTR